MLIREVSPTDAAALCALYNYYIEHTAISFETDPFSVEEMRSRIGEITAKGFPYYVGEAEGKIVGYCYLHTWNKREAYDTTAEVSIYLADGETGKGYGSLLMKHLLENTDRKRFHQLVAGICLPNEGSVRLHEKFGFRPVSHFPEIGRKFDRWWDVGHWLLTL